MQAEARGDAQGMFAQLAAACRASASCAATVRADAATLRRPGSVEVLSTQSTTNHSLTGSVGETRVAWKVPGRYPVVQCVRVRRSGNVLTGISVSLLRVGPRIGDAPPTAEGRLLKSPPDGRRPPPSSMCASASPMARAPRGACAATGRVPGILYGGGSEPLSFDVDARELRLALARAGAVLDLSIDGAAGHPGRAQGGPAPPGARGHGARGPAAGAPGQTDPRGGRAGADGRGRVPGCARRRRARADHARAERRSAAHGDPGGDRARRRGDADRRDPHACRRRAARGGHAAGRRPRRRCWRRSPRRGCRPRRHTEIEAETEVVGEAEKAEGAEGGASAEE